jgi:hypothetical protein
MAVVVNEFEVVPAAGAEAPSGQQPTTAEGTRKPIDVEDQVERSLRLVRERVERLRTY